MDFGRGNFAAAARYVRLSMVTSATAEYLQCSDLFAADKLVMVSMNRPGRNPEGKHKILWREDWFSPEHVSVWRETPLKTLGDKNVKYSLSPVRDDENLLLNLNIRSADSLAVKRAFPKYPYEYSPTYKTMVTFVSG